ncbi:MAG: hypothetical protein JWM68_4557 [Verrucomicrobiales bacterium]|nr:hypothetical protein [Verrucomicrobiales bacterium]
MKTRLFICMVSGLITFEQLVHGETVWDTGSAGGDSTSTHRQRIGVGYRMNYNVSTKFNNLGGFTARSNPGPATGSAVDRTYDDGFNRVDVSGNAGGQTWFWGYNSASQVVGDSIVMSSRSSNGNQGVEASDDPQHGIEVTYNLELGGSKRWRWGLEAGANYAALNITDNRSLSGNVTTISDAFALNGVTPPMAPYAGTFIGPGVMIGSTPTRTVTTTPGGATILGERQLDANLFGMRLGPYIELPLSRRFAISFSGGLALLEVSSDFQFRETVNIAGIGTSSRSGSSSEDAFMAGGYVSGNVSFQLTDKFSLFTGVQFYNLGTHTQEANGKSAELDLGTSIGVVLGGSYSF